MQKDCLNRKINLHLPPVPTFTKGELHPRKS
jgi:hypothetical protein